MEIDARELGSRIAPDYDRAKEIKAFDDTKAGVKGLVDAGVLNIPPFFIRPVDELNEKSSDNDSTNLKIPVIDLEGIEKDVVRRKEVVHEVGRASEKWGFFQVVNHGIPINIMDEVIEGVRRFNELDSEAKKEFYSRDPARKVKFLSNYDLYQTRSANWRDSLLCSMVPEPPQSEELPAVCREIMIEYTKHVMSLGETLFELISEALGLNPNHLKDIECAKECTLSSSYYPACPEPELTLGNSKHTDPAFLNVLLQDQIGGLQVLQQHQWVDVPPIPGALVINIGDLLQLITNDKFRSVKHRVLANRFKTRISVAFFFSTSYKKSTRLYGPIKELLSADDPPKYREILVKDFLVHVTSKEPDGNSPLAYFKV